MTQWWGDIKVLPSFLEVTHTTPWCHPCTGAFCRIRLRINFSKPHSFCRAPSPVLFYFLHLPYRFHLTSLSFSKNSLAQESLSQTLLLENLTWDSKTFDVKTVMQKKTRQKINNKSKNNSQMEGLEEFSSFQDNLFSKTCDKNDSF